jgi:hypothetical protein
MIWNEVLMESDLLYFDLWEGLVAVEIDNYLAKC